MIELNKKYWAKKIEENRELQTFLIVLPVLFSVWFFDCILDGIISGTELELMWRRSILFFASWIAAGLPVLVIAGILRLFKMQISPLVGAILIAFLYFPTSVVGRSLAEDWMQAHFNAVAEQIRSSGVDEKYVALYSERHQDSEGLWSVTWKQVLSTTEFGVLSGIVWIPILLISRKVLGDVVDTRL